MEPTAAPPKEARNLDVLFTLETRACVGTGTHRDSLEGCASECQWQHLWWRPSEWFSLSSLCLLILSDFFFLQGASNSFIIRKKSHWIEIKEQEETSIYVWPLFSVKSHWECRICARMDPLLGGHWKYSRNEDKLDTFLVVYVWLSMSQKSFRAVNWSVWTNESGSIPDCVFVCFPAQRFRGQLPASRRHTQVPPAYSPVCSGKGVGTLGLFICP